METETSRENAKPSGAKSALLGRPMNLLEEMERMFEPLQRRGSWLRPFRNEWPELSASLDQRIPNIDMVDYDDHILLRAELPGIDKKDVSITMTDKSITLNGSTRKETKEEQGEYYCHEISSGSFTRSMTLPCLVDDSKAKAKFHDGMLELTVPKIEKSTRHSIKID